MDNFESKFTAFTAIASGKHGKDPALDLPPDNRFLSIKQWAFLAMAVIAVTAVILHILYILG